MKWLLVVLLATLAATVTINVLLLAYGGSEHDPVGRLSPVADLLHSNSPVPARVDDRLHPDGADD